MLLLLCISELQNKGLLVPRHILMLKAEECAGNGDISFQDMHRWCEKFMKWETVSLQQRTIIGQKLQAEFETNLTEYHYIIGQGQRNQYSLIQINKTGETALFSTCRTTALQIPKEKNHTRQSKSLVMKS